MSLRQDIQRTERRPTARRAQCWLLAVATIVIAICPGCARWNWRGKGFDDNTTGWTDKLRPPADEKQFSGLDARAKEIERNLGVR
jgi:hypothetical protein